MAPILFLDFDGVTHPDPCPAADSFCRLPLIEHVLREFAAVEVVISSAWRCAVAHLPLELQLESLRRHFAEDIRPRVIGLTPDLWGDRLWEPGADLGYPRERECLAWLQAHRPHEVPWLALDDRGNLFRQHCPQLLLVEDVAFSDENARQLRSRLAAMLERRDAAIRSAAGMR